MLDTKRLTRDWIQFLKNNRIVSGSDPATGKLNYRKKVTPELLAHFLETKTDFDEETIAGAIHSILANKATSGAEPPPARPTQGRRFNTDDAEDVPYRDIPDNEPQPSAPPQLTAPQARLSAPAPAEEPQQPKPKSAPRKLSGSDEAIRKRSARTPGGRAFSQMQQTLAPGAKRRNKLREDVAEEVGYELNEKDIENVFSILASGAGRSEGPTNNEQPTQQTSSPAASLPPDPEHQEAKKQEDVRKLKRMVRDSMTPSQRKALWRALNESVLTEAQIEPTDINAVFKDAYKVRSASTSGVKGAIGAGLGKINKGLQKSKLELSDLQQAWRDAGYPDDTRDIEAILRDHGFGNKEIHKIFSNVFGEGDHEDETVSSPAAIKIAEYAKSHGIKDELLSFLEKEYGEELGLQKPGMLKRMWRAATSEDVKQIFTSILQEERTQRDILVREQTQRLLGRNRK